LVNKKLIETITLPITFGNWHYSRIREIGNVVDSIGEPQKKQKQLLFIMTSGVDRFVSFGHRCWIFAKKQDQNLQNLSKIYKSVHKKQDIQKIKIYKNS